MQQSIEINGREYRYIYDYKEDTELRKSFNDLAKKNFGLDLEPWYQDGYWKERYVPYSLLDGDRIVSNVSINIIDFMVMGKKKRYLQLGTVMTDEAYRSQGLGRVLIEKVLNEWKNKCDFIYLFGNDSVVDYYPKFGFVPVEEYQFTKLLKKETSSLKVRNLSMDDKKDRQLLYDKASGLNPFSKLSMQENPSLIMFYCTSFMPDSAYYIEQYDAVVIASLEEDKMYLHEVFCSKEVLLEDLIHAVMNEKTEKVILGFTPMDDSSYIVDILKEEDRTLFVQAGKQGLFETNQIMFPTLSHA